MKTLNIRSVYHTMMQYLPIVAIVWAIFYSGAGIGWWLASAVISCILTIYGFSIGFHHTFAHRTFTFPKPVEYILAYIGMCATLVSPISWASGHDAHHRFVDTQDDPHSPKHLGWKVLLFYNHTTDKANSIRFRHLYSNPVHIWLNSNLGYWTVVLSYPVIALLIGGINGLVFLWAIPTFYLLLTAMVFVLAHYGEENEYGNKAVNALFLWVFSMGDGNHEKHHAQWDYLSALHRKCAVLIGAECNSIGR
jgi:fatty-acid desaturase